MLKDLFVHAATIVSNGQQDELTGEETVAIGAIRFLKSHPLRLDGHLAHTRNGIAGIDAQIGRIWSICAGSIFTGPKAEPGCQTRSISSPMRRRRILSIPSTVSFRSSTRGLMVCFRAKARSCRVISVDRWPHWRFP